ncbi:MULTISPECIES: transporter substrate-binding domain-containing protein [unclassified Acidovorax]|uniref:transporter substrate-binding domain-containing protein n=1 Tax=unclassified Acidovorax TaxID=2684926 RepID=UPI000B3FF95D|nr:MULTISPECIES: transporter substrate-binding domain-containing protein [unclassified Acidovorax]
MAEPRALPSGGAAVQPRPLWRAIQRRVWLAALAALAAAGWVAMSRWPADAYLLVAAFAPANLSAPAPGPLLLQARERGVLRVGVREYPRPSLPSDPLPPEPDSYDAGLASHIAQQLGVKVQLVGLAPEQVATATAAGQVDLVLAGSPPGPAGTPTPMRGAVPYVKGPGRIVVMRKSPLESPAHLAGLNVCVAQGSPYAEPLRERLGARPVQYRSAVHAVSAFMAGECAALAEDEGLLQRLLAQTEWRFYRLLDDAIAPAPSAQVQLAQADPESARHLDAVLDQWRAQGLEAQARLQRTSEIMLEVALLQDGAICH